MASKGWRGKEPVLNNYRQTGPGDKTNGTGVDTRSHARNSDAASHALERAGLSRNQRRRLPVLLLVAVLAKPLLPLVRRDLMALALASAGHSVDGFVRKETACAVRTAFKIRIPDFQNQSSGARKPPIHAEDAS